MCPEPISPRKLANNEINTQLDDALEQTFPASDPFAVGQTTSTEPRRPADRRPPLIDKRLVRKLAETLKDKIKDQKR
jgi:hypothetical protein